MTAIKFNEANKELTKPNDMTDVAKRFIKPLLILMMFTVSLATPNNPKYRGKGDV